MQSLDANPAFHLNVDPDPGSQTQFDLCGSGSWSDFIVTNSLILHEKSTQRYPVDNTLGQKHTIDSTKVQKSLFERQETRLIS
jgi:hypothetical protein